MSLVRSFLYHASRSRLFLWSFGLGILALGGGIGFHLAQQHAARTDLLGERILATASLPALADDDERLALVAEVVTETPPQLLEALDAELATGKVPFRDLLAAIPVIAAYFDPEGDKAAAEIFKKHYPKAEADLATDLLATWYGREPKAYERIVASSKATPPPPFVHHVLGRIDYHSESYRTAYEHFRRDTDAATVDESRFWATRALAEEKNFAELARLQALPEFAPHFDSHLRLKVAIGQKDWPTIIRMVPLTQLESYGQPEFIIAILTGLAWGFFLAVLGDLPGPLSGRAALCLLALLAGMVSTTPTLYLVILTEDIFNLSMGENLVHHFAFFTGGVAAREEVFKLLLFVPFLPILYRRDNELEVLIVASFVGLGFAMEENGSYFLFSAAAAAPGRFLSANFFHIALTGMNGLALYRVCTHGWRGLNQFLLIFPVTILAHGGYDTFLSSDQIEYGSYWAMAVYVLFAQYYLRTAHALRPSGGHRTFSLTGALVFGISTVAAVVLAYQMSTLGALPGATLMMSELLGSALLLFLFFHVFNETLTD